jgi:DNA-binding protein HU-beta
MHDTGLVLAGLGGTAGHARAKHGPAQFPAFGGRNLPDGQKSFHPLRLAIGRRICLFLRTNLYWSRDEPKIAEKDSRHESRQHFTSMINRCHTFRWKPYTLGGRALNKTQFIDAVAARLNADHKSTAAILDAITDEVYANVVKGEKVILTGFGAFEKRDRAARIGRNPATGAKVRVKKTAVPAFRPGTEFKEIIAGRRKVAKAPAKKVAAKAAPATKAVAAKTGTAAKTITAKATPAKPARGTATKTAAAAKAPAKTATKTAAPAKTATNSATKAPAKTAAAKTTAAKTTTAKASAAKAPAKTPAAKTTAAKSSAAKSSAAKSSAAKTPAAKAPAKTAAAKTLAAKSPAAKAPAKTAAAKTLAAKSPAAKAPAKTAAAKATPAKRSTARKAPAKNGR